jgi:hypothetical protein
MPATVLQIGPLRTCSKCVETKLVSSFYRTTKVKSGLLSICKTCMLAKQSEWVKGRGELEPTRRKNRYYKIDFNGLWEKQGGLCSVCRTPMLPKGKTAKSVVVDHDRRCCPGRGSCGQCVRGLIHSRCNIIVGVLESESATVALAKDYLEKQKC